MIDALKLLAWFVGANGQLEAEIVILGHQLNVLRRRMPSPRKPSIDGQSKPVSLSTPERTPRAGYDTARAPASVYRWRMASSGGHITVESELGRGTCVEVFLPAER